jgi:hypothetical protein
MKAAPVAVLTLLLSSAPSPAADNIVRVRWGELSAHVVGRKISTVLTDGASVEGRVTAVQPEALALRVTKTSDPRRFSKDAQLPRSSLTVVQVRRDGWKWKVIAPIVGVIGLAVAGGAIGGHIDSDGFIISNGAAIGVVVGAAVGATAGYFIGRAADHHTRTVEIIRE